MLQEVEKGADYVATWRTPRVDSKWGSGSSHLFNSMVRGLTGVPLHDLNSGLRVLRRRLAKAVPVYGDLHRFWPVLAARKGFRVVEVPVQHLEERRGPGPLGVGAYARRALDLLTLFFLVKFTEKPLRFFGLFGAGALAAGGLLGGVLCVQRYFGRALSDRPMLIFAVLLIVLGIQLFALGLLGELIIFTRGKRLREYQVEKVFELKRRSDEMTVANGSRESSMPVAAEPASRRTQGVTA
jgi:hypothetical protein